MVSCLGHAMVWGLRRVCTGFLPLCLACLVNSLVLCGSILLESTSLASLFLLRSFIVPNKGGDTRKFLELDTMWLFLGEKCTNTYSTQIGSLGTMKEMTLPKSSFVNHWVYWDNLEDHGDSRQWHHWHPTPAWDRVPGAPWTICRQLCSRLFFT